MITLSLFSAFRFHFRRHFHDYWCRWLFSLSLLIYRWYWCFRYAIDFHFSIFPAAILMPLFVICCYGAMLMLRHRYWCYAMRATPCHYWCRARACHTFISCHARILIFIDAADFICCFSAAFSAFADDIFAIRWYVRYAADFHYFAAIYFLIIFWLRHWAFAIIGNTHFWYLFRFRWYFRYFRFLYYLPCRHFDADAKIYLLIPLMPWLMPPRFAAFDWFSCLRLLRRWCQLWYADALSLPLCCHTLMPLYFIISLIDAAFIDAPDALRVFAAYFAFVTCHERCFRWCLPLRLPFTPLYFIWYAFRWLFISLFIRRDVLHAADVVTFSFLRRFRCRWCWYFLAAPMPYILPPVAVCLLSLSFIFWWCRSHYCLFFAFYWSDFDDAFRCCWFLRHAIAFIDAAIFFAFALSPVSLILFIDYAFIFAIYFFHDAYFSSFLSMRSFRFRCLIIWLLSSDCYAIRHWYWCFLRFHEHCHADASFLWCLIFSLSLSPIFFHFLLLLSRHLLFSLLPALLMLIDTIIFIYFIRWCCWWCHAISFATLPFLASVFAFSFRWFSSLTLISLLMMPMLPFFWCAAFAAAADDSAYFHFLIAALCHCFRHFLRRPLYTYMMMMPLFFSIRDVSFSLLYFDAFSFLFLSSSFFRFHFSSDYCCCFICCCHLRAMLLPFSFLPIAVTLLRHFFFFRLLMMLSIIYIIFAAFRFLISLLIIFAMMLYFMRCLFYYWCFDFCRHFFRFLSCFHWCYAADISLISRYTCRLISAAPCADAAIFSCALWYYCHAWFFARLSDAFASMPRLLSPIFTRSILFIITWLIAILHAYFRWFSFSLMPLFSAAMPLPFSLCFRHWFYCHDAFDASMRHYMLPMLLLMPLMMMLAAIFAYAIFFIYADFLLSFADYFRWFSPIIAAIFTIPHIEYCHILYAIDFLSSCWFLLSIFAISFFFLLPMMLMLWWFSRWLFCCCWCWYCHADDYFAVAPRLRYADRCCLSFDDDIFIFFSS